jgi:hypothetical protein
MQINQWRILGDQLLRKSPIEVKDNSNIWPSSSEKFDLGIYPSCTLSIALINPTREGMVGCRQVIQICKYWGIKTINVVRRDDHVEELKALGADEIINSSTEGKSTNFSNLEYTMIHRFFVSV